MESSENYKKSEQKWKEELSGEEYRILREAGTEKPFSGDYYDLKKEGIYQCAGCSEPLFHSDTKFDSGTGWPSFYKPIDSDSIQEVEDHSMGRTRTEVLCASCEGHLGHVFQDGPDPTGLRYCINSKALDFEELN